MPPYVRRPFAALPKATFCYAMTVMDKVEGWTRVKVGKKKNGYDRTSPRQCGYTPPLDLQSTLATMIESASWVTEESLWDHEWITETKVTMKENLVLEALHCDIEVPCPLQWALLWFFSTNESQSQVRE